VDEKRDDQQVDPAIVQFARFKGRQLAGRYGFPRHDAEDIQQELLLDYLQRSKSFDSHRCNRRSFARLVVNHRVATLLKAQKAACRDPRVCRSSLDESAGGPSLAQRGEILRDLRSVESNLNLRLDVERILRCLPAALMSICRLLMVCDSAVDAASRAGISRATLYRRLQEVRRAFAEAGWVDTEALKECDQSSK
jgi:DNA-directed RNA polymerase specialized sigma24 family protein